MAIKTVLHSRGPEETESLAARLSRRLVPGDVVLVAGEVGAGKTTFIRGAARALGVTVPITSPTFSIAHRYRGKNLTVSHLDLYRVTDLSGEDPELLGDYLGPDRLAFVEWPRGELVDSPDVRLTVVLRDRESDWDGEGEGEGEGDVIGSGEDRILDVEWIEGSSDPEMVRSGVRR